MSKAPNFDIVEANRYFAVNCFNGTWDFIDKKTRTPLEDRQMIATTFASLYHWMHRPDCTPKNLSVAYWQISRVHALAGFASEAKRYAEVCLGYSSELEPFYQGYAYEALARAELVAGNKDAAQEFAQKAQDFANQVKEPSEKELLVKDLVELKAA